MSTSDPGERILPPADARAASAISEFENETDRGIAIIGVALLDSTLLQCLKLRLKRPESDGDELTKKALQHMFSPEAPLGSFSARYKMAYLMGIIGPVTFKDLRIINDIRNEFAHYVSAENPHRKMEPLSFTMNKVANMVRSLSGSEGDLFIKTSCPEASKFIFGCPWDRKRLDVLIAKSSKPFMPSPRLP